MNYITLMIKYWIIIISMLSLLFPSFYNLGDVINYEHQNIPIEVCYGQEENIGTTIYLGEHNAGITILGLASWG